jgi:ABC-type Fe3+ transport system permease subunit
MLKRGIARVFGWVLRFVVLAPIASLLLATILDEGPEHGVRLTLFPVALAVFDPLVWTSLWNSLAVAIVVAVVSILIGVRLGLLISRERFWSRPLLGALVIAPGVISPGFLALGMLGLFPPDGPGIWRRLEGVNNAFLGPSGDSWPWCVWIWSALVQGVALVVLMTTMALRRLVPSREEAASLVGARRSQVWWTLTWPMIRPYVGETAALLFMLTLVDPSVPLIMGLRRTPGFQVVTSALNSDNPFPRVAGLGVLCLVITVTVAAVVRWWAGAPAVPDLTNSLGRRESECRASHTPRTRALLSGMTLLVWSFLAWLPVVGLALLGLTATSSLANPLPAGLARAGEFFSRFSTHPAPLLVFQTALLGLVVGLVIAFPAWLAPHHLVRTTAGRSTSVFYLLTSTVPAMLSGVGILAVPRLARMCSAALGSGPGWSWAALSLETLAGVLDPCNFPGVLLIVGVCVIYVPRVLIRGRAIGLDRATDRLIDQAMVAGSRPQAARRLAHRSSNAIPIARIVLCASVAATSISPAILLAHRAESLPLGPGILSLADQPGGSRAQAATLALAAIALNASVLGWAWAAGGSRSSPLEARDLV